MCDGFGPPFRVISFFVWVLIVISVDCNGSASTSLSPSPTVNPRSQSLLEKTIITWYIPFHRANRHTAPRLIYRYRGSQPGFGNRVSNLLTAFTLASLSRRILIVDWREPYDLFTFYDAQLNLKYGTEDEDESEKECKSVACKASLLSAVLPKRYRTVVYSEGFLHAGLGLIKQMLREHQELGAAKALKDVLNEPFNEAQLFKKMFDCMVKPGKELAQLMSAHSKEVNTRFIAVHARLGAGLHEFGPRWEKTSPLALAKCLARNGIVFGKELGVKKFYLATDTASFRPIFERELKERGGVYMKVGKVEPVHTRDCAAHPRGCLQAVFEFMILSKAHGIVASKSTFSQAAGFIGGVEHSKTILDSDC